MKILLVMVNYLKLLLIQIVLVKAGKENGMKSIKKVGIFSLTLFLFIGSASASKSIAEEPVEKVADKAIGTNLILREEKLSSKNTHQMFCPSTHRAISSGYVLDSQVIQNFNNVRTTENFPSVDKKNSERYGWTIRLERVNRDLDQVIKWRMYVLCLKN